MTDKPVCAICGERVLKDHEAWISHRYGLTVHLNCTRDLGKGWYSRLLEKKGVER